MPCYAPTPMANQFGDDDGMLSLHRTLPTHTAVLNLDDDKHNQKDPYELPDFIKQEDEEDAHLILTQDIPQHAEPPYTRISSEELINSQLYDTFYSEVGRVLERGCRYCLESMTKDLKFEPSRILHK